MTEKDSNRGDIDSLLPWYVNGTLSQEERQRVETRLRNDPDMAREVELLRATQRSMQSKVHGSPGEFGWRRLQKDIRSQKVDHSDKRIATNRWWRPALAAAALVILVQGGVLLHLLGEPSTYQPAGGAVAGTVLQVRFQPGASASQIQQLLQEIGGSIVQGPSALGLYRIRLPEGKDADAVVAQLRERSRLIDYATKQ